MRIPNRLVALLIVAGFVLAIAGVFYWLFSYNTSTLVVTTDPVGARVSVERDRVGLYERVADPRAIFEDIPALEYELVVSASGYETSRRSVTLKRGESTETGVRLVPRAYFEELSDIPAMSASEETPTETATGSDTDSGTGDTSTGSTATGSTADISEISDDEPASSGIVVRERPALQILSSSGTVLYRHGRAGSDAVVHAEEGFVSFHEGDIPYVYDLEYDRAMPVAGWSGAIVSVRRTPDRDRWVIHGPSDSATYSVRDGSLLPHPFFNDYIYLDASTVLGIVDSADTARWNRLGEKSPGHDAVVLLDVTSKAYRIISNDRDDLVRIEFSPDGPVVYGRDGKRYVVRNFR